MSERKRERERERQRDKERERWREKEREKIKNIHQFEILGTVKLKHQKIGGEK